MQSFINIYRNHRSRHIMPFLLYCCVTVLFPRFLFKKQNKKQSEMGALIPLKLTSGYLHYLHSQSCMYAFAYHLQYMGNCYFVLKVIALSSALQLINVSKMSEELCLFLQRLNGLVLLIQA